MKEYRFKVLREGDFLCHFSGSSMVIGCADGNFHIHDISGFDIGEPSFSKKFETITMYQAEGYPENITSVKTQNEYRIYKVISIENSLPKLEESFCLVVTRGIGKIEIYNTEKRTTFTLPAKERP